MTTKTYERLRRLLAALAPRQVLRRWLMRRPPASTAPACGCGCEDLGPVEIVVVEGPPPGDGAAPAAGDPEPAELETVTLAAAGEPPVWCVIASRQTPVGGLAEYTIRSFPARAPAEVFAADLAASGRDVDVLRLWQAPPPDTETPRHRLEAAWGFRPVLAGRRPLGVG